MNAAAKNKIFDIVLAEALKECMNEELEEVDRIVAAENYEFSPNFEKEIRKTVNSAGRKSRIKKYARDCVKAVISLAAVFGILFGVLLTQPNVFAAVQNVFRSVFDKYDEYEFAGGDELTVENFDDTFRLGYIPDGFRLSEGYYSPIGVFLEYVSQQDDEIYFDYGIADGASIQLDNEHNTYYEFKRSGIEYHCYESHDSDFKSCLLWYDDGYFFMIHANLPKDELLKMAENMER